MSLSEPVDNVNQVKPKGNKSQRLSIGKLNMEPKKISCKFCGYEHPPEKKQHGVRRAKSVNSL